jgi:hypothetical protein
MRRRAIWPAVLVGSAAAIGACAPEAETAAPSLPLPADWSSIPEPVQASIREAVARCAAAPGDAAAVERLGRVYHGNEQSELAAAAYAAAIEMGADGAGAHYLLGLI